MPDTGCLCPMRRSGLTGRLSASVFALIALAVAVLLTGRCAYAADGVTKVIAPSVVRGYVERFNAMDDELYRQRFPNDSAADFLLRNVPLLDCPDKQLEQTYYFRWWTFRKHIRQTAEGHVITEFLPDVSWAGRYNAISCAASHHFYEGRWLRNGVWLSDYVRYWFGGGGRPRLYSCWIADALVRYLAVHPDDSLLRELYPCLKDNYAAWESEHRDSTGLFWQTDNRDGMECSVSGRLAPRAEGYRATINSYMYGDLMALALMARRLGKAGEAKEFEQKARELRRLINTRLWSEAGGFYMVMPRNGDGRLSPVRELHGYTPWYFDIPPASRALAWAQLMDSAGFFAPYGLTTVERRSPSFALSYTGHECQWNGPGWPYATSVTLTAMANLLRHCRRAPVSACDYMNLLCQYSRSHIRTDHRGDTIPWIDENINPLTGDWISRTRLAVWSNGTWSPRKGGRERGKDYNHSTFCDLVISGLLGVQPQADGSLLIWPLLPPGRWPYYCLQDVPYRGHLVTIVYDSDGTRYSMGRGYTVYADGRRIHRSRRPSPFTWRPR